MKSAEEGKKILTKLIENAKLFDSVKNFDAENQYIFWNFIDSVKEYSNHLNKYTEKHSEKKGVLGPDDYFPLWGETIQSNLSKQTLKPINLNELPNFLFDLEFSLRTNKFPKNTSQENKEKIRSLCEIISLEKKDEINFAVGAFVPILGLINNAQEEKAIKDISELREICASYKADLLKYKAEVVLEQKIEFDKGNYEKSEPLGSQRINTQSAIEIVEALEKILKEENTAPVKKIANFINLINQENEETGKKINQSKLIHAYKGKTFIQKIKEFLGLADKKLSTHSFFKSVTETLRAPEEKERIQQDIEALKFTRMR